MTRNYRRALVVRWSRRDRLAALVVAVTVGFLVGTALLVVAGGAQTAALAADFDAGGTAAFVDDPTVDAAGDALVLPLAVVETPDGERAVAIGVPEGTDRTFGDRDRPLERLGGTTLGTVDAPTEHRLVGPDGTVTLDVAPRDDESVVPPTWYVTSPETVEALGADGALVVGDADAADRAAARGGSVVPLRSALAFFAAGTGDALRLLAVLVGASGVLVGVTVYSVTRMAVRDRRETIQVARATGATPRAIVTVFAARAGLLSAVGAAAGYAIGVIVVAGAVNVAVVVGLPTSVDPRVSLEAARVLVPIVAAVPVVGALAGAIAARPDARAPPASVGRTQTGRLPVDLQRLPLVRHLRPRALDASVLVPTIATLAAFAAFALLFVAAAGVLVPMAGGGEAVVTQPGSSHPIDSQLSEGYVSAFDARDIDASAEILLFSVVDGRAVPARGARYEDFAAVSDADIADGRPPAAPNEAVVGVGAARTLGVEPGDELPLGGSTRAGVTRLEVVGTFEAPPPYADHVVVPLETARHLSGVRDENVNLIRGSALPGPTGEGVVVTDVSVERPPLAGEDVEVTVAIVNEAPTPADETVRVSFADQDARVDVSLAGAETARETVTFDGVDAGEYRLAAADQERTVSVVPPDAIRLHDVPGEAPPNSEPAVRVLDVRDTPVEDAVVTLHDRSDPSSHSSVLTDADGLARLSLPSAGTYDIRAEANDQTDAATVTVPDDAERAALVDLSVSPSPADLLVRPTARLELSNPWNETLTHEVSLEGPGGTSARSVTLAPGERTTVTRDLQRQPVGEYAVAAAVDDESHETTYRVVGDDRAVSALATRGQAGDSTFERALETAFGNVQVLGGALVALAGTMAVGATAASFAGAVHARRESLGVRRATGASPAAVIRLVLGDALRLGGVAAVAGTAIALGALWLLDGAGLLATYGIRLWPGLTATAVLGVVGAAVAVALAGAAVATLGVLRVSPAALLAGRTREEDDPREEFDG